MHQSIPSFLLILVATALLLGGCTENTEINRELVGPNNLIITIHSPNTKDICSSAPELDFTITEGPDNQPVELSRITIQIFPVIDGVRQKPIDVNSIPPPILLPDLGDGTFEMEIYVSYEGNSEPFMVWTQYTVDNSLGTEGCVDAVN